MLRQIAMVLVLSAFSSIAGAATPFAQGATLNVDQGTVLVNNGTQFVTAKPGQTIKPGDRVMVMTGGSATVKYADGHSSTLPSGTMVSFDSHGFGGYTANGSAGAPAHATALGPMYAQAVGHPDDNDDTHCGYTDANGYHNRCVAGFFIGLGVVAVFAATRNGTHDSTHHREISAP